MSVVYKPKAKPPPRDAIEVATPYDVFLDLIRVAGDDVLIGGQALAVWVEHFGLAAPEDIPAISRDVDFLTKAAHYEANKKSMERYGGAIKGVAYTYPAESRTALVGQAYREIPKEGILNVDVLWQVFGIPQEDVRDNAMTLAFPDKSTGQTLLLLVMHPFDVLKSRLANLYKLREKQNEKGKMQLRLAIDVMRAYLRHLASQRAGEHAKEHAEALASGKSPLQPMVSAIGKLAAEDAARKTAKRYGVHVADAIDPTLIPAGPFWDRHWPVLRKLMSPEYAGAISPPVPPAATG